MARHVARVQPAGHAPLGMHVGIDGVSWTCGAVRSRDVDGLADELEALLA